MVVRSHEGREPVAPARVERAGARGRGEQATHPGGVGAPPGGQYGLPARSWLREAVHDPDGHEKRGPTPKENAGRRAGGRHAFAAARTRGLLRMAREGQGLQGPIGCDEALAGKENA